MGKIVSVDMGDDEHIIEIIKSELCSIKNCEEFATKNMCRIGMCPKHYEEAID